MAHELSRLSQSILEQPQLILPASFEEIVNVLQTSDRTELHKLAMEADKNKNKAGKGSEDLSETNVGVLRIEGALTNKPTMFGALCGLTSYQELLEQTKELCSMENINTIMMLVDSGGGEAYNLFSAATQIKEMCDKAGKYLVAYIDGSSASAAYGLTCVADEVIMHPDAMAGSIGVVVRLTNTNKRDKENGIETTYITFGSSKVPFNEDGDFKESFTADLQERVNELGSQFISHVASNRNISKQSVEDTQAKMFSSEKALELGLVDKIMTNEEFYDYLADISNPEEDSTPSKNVQTIKLENLQSTESKPMTDKVNTEATVDADLLAKLEKMEAAMNAQSEQLAAYQAKEVEAEKAALSAGLDKFAFLSEDKEAVVSFLSNEQVSAEHKELMHNVLASAQASVETLKETMSNEVSEIQAALDQANVDKEKLKEEFGAKEIASTDVPEELSLTEKLQAKVDAKKATKAKKD